VPNVIADKVGHFNVMIVMGALTSILILGLWLPSTGNVPIILFASLFGISSGAGISLTPALCARLSPIQDIGVRDHALCGDPDRFCWMEAGKSVRCGS